MTEKNDRIKALATTIGVHALLLILLAVLTISAAKPENREDGVPVLLTEEELDEEDERLAADQGDTDEAKADDDQGEEGSDEATEPVDEAPQIGNAAPIKPTVAPSEPKAPKPAVKDKPAAKPDPKPAKPVITQKDEKTIEAEQAAKREKEMREAEARKKAEAEAEARKRAEALAAQKAAEEAAAKKAAEEARKAEEARRAEEARKAAAAANKVSGAFGKNSGTSNGNSTASNGEGASGKGNGAGGVGGEYSVGNRKARNLPKPAYNDATSEGTIVVAIIVDPSGNVTTATIKSNNTNSVPLRNAALEAARKAKFSEGSATENGTITYHFKMK